MHLDHKFLGMDQHTSFLNRLYSTDSLSLRRIQVGILHKDSLNILEDIDRLQHHFVPCK